MSESTFTLPTTREVGAPGTAENNTRCSAAVSHLELQMQLGRPQSSPTSLRCLELLRGAGRPLPPAVVDPDVEQVEAEGVEARQQAAGVVPAEVQDVLLRVVAVVSVQAALSPVVHLRRGDSVGQRVTIVSVFRLENKITHITLCDLWYLESSEVSSQ